MGPVAAVIGAVATVAGTVISYTSQKKAADAQQKQQELATQRERRQAIREAQIRRAQAIAAGANMGGLGGSALAGGVGSLGSQLGSGLGFSTAMSAISSDISRYSQRAATGQAIAGIGSAVFQKAGGFDTMSTMFKKPTAAPVPTQPTRGPGFEYTGRY